MCNKASNSTSFPPQTGSDCRTKKLHHCSRVPWGLAGHWVRVAGGGFGGKQGQPQCGSRESISSPGGEFILQGAQGMGWESTKNFLTFTLPLLCPSSGRCLSGWGGSVARVELPQLPPTSAVFCPAQHNSHSWDALSPAG